MAAGGEAQRIAPATAASSRNSESDIIQLNDGRLLLGWTQFYGSTGADDDAARIVGRISGDGGLTWGEQYTLVENDGKYNVMEVNSLRLESGSIALFHLQKNAEVGAADAGECRVMMRVSEDEGKSFGQAAPLTAKGRYIETAPGDAFAYPSVTLTNDRALVTYFGYSGGTSLYLRAIPVAWFYA